MGINRTGILSLLFPILLGLLTSTSAQNNLCWNAGTEHVYSVRGRTLTGMHQVQNQYSGVFLNAKLYVTPSSQKTVIARVEDLKYAKIHQQMPGGWSMDIPDEQLQYEKVPNWSNEHFEVVYENGIIVNITFENNVAPWEANMIRGIISQLQVSRQNSTNFKVEESSVSGVCETLYDVVPAVQGKSHIPLDQTHDNEILEVIKTRNHDKCQNKVAFSFGHPETLQEAAGGNTGTFAAVSTVSNIIISGALPQHQILSVVSVNKIIMSPTLYNRQKGIVVSMMNLTEINQSATKSQPKQLKNPQPVSNLLYSYKKSDNNSPDFISQQFINAEQNSSESLSNPDIVEAAVRVAHEIAEGLQKPNQIPKQGTLSSHSILSNVVRAMTINDLQNATEKLYATDSADSTRVLAWKSYRDAVAQSGTWDALKQIKDFIMQRKIQGEEAAEVIAALPKSALNPDIKYLNDFFELAKNPEVQKQLFLNDTAILSFCELVRICNDGDSTRGHHPFGGNNNVGMTYVRYMEKQLKRAVEQGDSSQTQVYTRALGNIAHKSILQSFQPYLEGNSKMSEYQRLVVVMSMNEVAKAYPEETRSVLYQLYANPHESDEVRVAAVFQLMRTVPPAYILQRMAQYTEVDESEQVQSAVKSALESAAKLTQPEYQELALHAQAAFNMLNPKVRGLHYSRDYLEDFIVKGMPLAYKQTAQYEGSNDSIYPKSMYYSLRWNRGGYERQYVNFGSMVSSVRSLHDTFNNMADDNDTPKRQYSNSWVDKIKKMLNIKFDAEKLEGNFFWNIMDTKRFFAYDNNTIAQLPQAIKMLSLLIQNKQAFSYTKLLSPRNIILSFSTEMGLPFMYEMRTPSVINVGGHISGNSKPSIVDPVTNKIRVPAKVDLNGDIHATVSTRIESKISFLTAFDKNQYIAGYDKNIQMQLPITFEMTLDFKDQLFMGKVAPQNQQNPINMIHYSTWPYTSNYQISSLKPVCLSKGTYQIKTNPTQTVNQEIGERSTGMVFHLEAETGKHDLYSYAWLAKQYKQQNLISALWAPVFDESMQQRNWNLNYDSKKSTSKAVDFIVHYTDWEYGKPEVSLARTLNKQGVEIQNDEHSSAKWLRTKLAHSNLNAEYDESVLPRHRSVLAGFMFEGGMQPVVFTNLVYIRDLDEKPSLLMYYRQFSAVSKEYEPFFVLFGTSNDALKTPALNFVNSLSDDPSYTQKAILLYGRSILESSTGIFVKAHMKRTNERKQYLQQSAEAKQCTEQMSKNNFALPACANLTVQASYTDKMDIEMVYENVSPVSRNYTEKIYKALQFIGYPYYQQNSVNASGSGANATIKLNVRFEPNLEHVNVSINTPNSDASFNQVYVPRTIRPIVISHPYFNAHERVISEQLQFIEKNPDFVMDYDVANTLNNNTYPLSLTGSWYVAMYAVQNKTYEPKVDFVVLVRRVKQQYKEIIIVLPQDDGNEQVINFFPTVSRGSNRGTPTVKVDDKEIEPEHPKPASSMQQKPFTIYSLPNGVVKLIVPGKFYMLYNNVRAMFAVDNKYRNSIRGLSGPFDGKAAHDFTNPDNRILKNAKDFVASYALPVDRDTAELQKHAKEAKSTPKDVKHRTILSSKNSQVQDLTNQIEIKSSDQSDSSCSKQQTQYRIEDDGKVICFTTRSQPACRNHCQSLNNFEKKVDVHCVQRTSVAEVWRKQIDKGASPDFSSKKVTKTIRIQVPGRCVEK